MVNIGDMTIQGDAVREPLGKAFNFSRDLSTATGQVAYTGIGFKPSSMVAVAAISVSETVCMGLSGAASDAGGCVSKNPTIAEQWRYSMGGGLSATPIWGATASGDGQSATVASWDSDGFTLDWEKSGSPTGNLNCMVLCIK
jgi:hypothetical protein